MSEPTPTPQLIANRYQIVERIGQGGMGDVFRGIDITTQQSVAIKQLKPDILEYDPTLLERFVREGEALRKLNHPNIVKMLDTVEERGQHFIMLQYVAGGSLRDLLDSTSKLPIDRVLAIGIELADALTRAHHLKIVHRDLKPANILIDTDGTPLLTDFGVARIDSRTRVTETGSVIGTYAYLSPEACMGEPLDVRADIWSFGIILYEMITGQRPFDHEQATAILLAIINNPLPNLSALREDVPSTLVQLIDGMLQKDRNARVPSVRMVGAALEAIQSGATTSLPTSVPLSGQQGDPASRFTTPTPAPISVPPDTLALGPPTADSILIFGLPTGERSLQQAAESPAASQTSSHVTGQVPPGATPTSTYPPGYTQPPHPAQPDSEVRWKSVTIMFTATLFAAVALVAILLFSGVFGEGDESGEGDGDNEDQSTQISNPQGQGNAGLNPDNGNGPLGPLSGGEQRPREYIVLVADIGPVGDVEQRDVTNFVANDLIARLEREIPFSNVRVVRYNGSVTDGQAAQLAARQHTAAVVIWGTYSEEYVQLEVQVGVTPAFPQAEAAIFANDKLDRRLLESTTNITVRLTDEQTQSVAIPVLNVFNVLQTADGNAYETLRLMAIIDVIAHRNVEADEPLTGDIVSGGAASLLHQAQLHYFEDTDRAIEDYTAAIDLFPANPLLYVFRAAAYLRLGDTEKALADIRTAERTGPVNWTAPAYLRATYSTDTDMLDESIAELDAIIAQRPNDWFAYNYRGSLYYLQGDYERAQADLLAAANLQPNANFPYLTLFSIALRRGDFGMMQQYLDTALSSFGDPVFSLRIAEAFFGPDSPHMPVFGPMYAAFGSVLLGQYERALENTDRALAINDQIADLYMIQGLAHCAMGDYAAAEESYTHGIEAEPDYIALYGMRAETRLRQREWDGLAEDTAVVLQSDLAPAFAALMQAGMSGEWRCDGFFEFDFNSLKPLTADELEAFNPLPPDLSQDADND